MYHFEKPIKREERRIYANQNLVEVTTSFSRSIRHDQIKDGLTTLAERQNMIFGKKIKELREKQGLGQRQLLAALDICPKRLSLQWTFLLA